MSLLCQGGKLCSFGGLEYYLPKTPFSITMLFRLEQKFSSDLRPPASTVIWMNEKRGCGDGLELFVKGVEGGGEVCDFWVRGKGCGWEWKIWGDWQESSNGGLNRVDKKSASKSGPAEHRSYLYIFLIWFSLKPMTHKPFPTHPPHLRPPTPSVPLPFPSQPTTASAPQQTPPHNPNVWLWL